MRLLIALWCCFVIKGVFYASFLPLWEGYDEFSHFTLVEYLATHGSLPNPVTVIPMDVCDSLRLAPVPWVIKDWDVGWVSHDRFWQLSSAEIHRRERRLSSLTDAADSCGGELRLYEAQQPPLAYALLVAFYLPLQQYSIALRVWVLRLVCVLIASIVIPAGFALARNVGLNYWRAIAVAGVSAAAPELMMMITHVSNEALALALATVCIAVWMRLLAKPRRPLISSALLGLLLGCCLLTKAYFLALVPVVFGTLLIRPRRAVIVVVLAAGISGWWYAHNLVTTKTISGEQIEVAAERSGMSLASAAREVHWRPVADFAMTSHIWLGGWSFLTLRSWMYRAIELLLLAALAGICVQLLRPSRLPPVRFSFAILLLPQCLFWMGLVYSALASYRSTRVAGALGYYPWCLAVPEVLCLLVGIERISPARFQAFCAPLVTVCFAAIEIFSSNFLLIPYYAGLIMHSSGGGVPAAHVSALWNAFPEPLLSRLAFAKPFPLAGPTVVSLWLLFLCSILAPVGISVLSGMRGEEGRLS